MSHRLIEKKKKKTAENLAPITHHKTRGPFQTVSVLSLPFIFLFGKLKDAQSSPFKIG